MRRKETRAGKQASVEGVWGTSVKTAVQSSLPCTCWSVLGVCELCWICGLDCSRTENSHCNEMVVPGALGFLVLQGSENSSSLLGVCKSTARPSQCVKKLTIPF